MMIIMTSLLTRKYKFDVKKKKKVFQIHCDKFNNNNKKSVIKVPKFYEKEYLI